MRTLLTILTCLALSGCAGEPTKLTATSGGLMRVNVTSEPATARAVAPSVLYTRDRPNDTSRSRFLVKQTPHLQYQHYTSEERCVLIVEWPTGDQLQVQLDVALCLDDRLWPAKKAKKNGTSPQAEDKSPTEAREP